MSILSPVLRPVLGPVLRRVTDGGVGGVFVPSVDAYRADTATSALSIATYDGGNEPIHPSVVDMGSGGWNGKRYWLAATPYTGSVPSIENPCIYSADSMDGPWSAPVGLTNPIEGKPSGAGYNSDTHLIDGRDGYLYCVWRAFEDTEPRENIYYRRSLDGVTWGDKTLMVSNTSAVRRMVSPAVEWDGAQWVMYAVDIVPSPYRLVRSTAASLAGPWSAPELCTLTMPAGRAPWHLDAKLRYGRWWLLLQDTTLGASQGGNLYLCSSTDGLSFDRPTDQVISPLATWHESIYRSCLVPKVSAGKLAFDVLYTGNAIGGGYGLGRTEILPFNVSAYLAEPASAIAGAVSATAPYLVGDDFNRADGAIGTASSGEVWTVSAGVPRVVGNKAGAGTATNTRGYIEVGAADAYIEAALSDMDLSTHQQYLLFRLSDADNYWRIGCTGVGAVLQKVVAGVVTTVVTGSWALVLGENSAVRVGVRCEGDQITIYLNGKLSISVTDAHNNTATKAGFQTQNTTSRTDNFFAKALT